MSLYASQPPLAVRTCADRQGLIKLLFTTIHLLHMNEPLVPPRRSAAEPLFRHAHTQAHTPPPRGAILG